MPTKKEIKHDLVLPCDCLGGGKNCSRLEIDRWKDDNDIELCLDVREYRKQKNGKERAVRVRKCIFLNENSVKKLKKFL